MRSLLRSVFAAANAAVLICLTLLVGFPGPAVASAYDGKPKLIVIVVIDQFRGDYLERYRADFKGSGFRLFLDRGANFTDCYYDYANTVTAPGHSTLATGAYTDGHGIPGNQWWDLSRNTKRPVSSVEDDRYTAVAPPGACSKDDCGGASPRNLMASTLGDELRLATQGQSKVYAVSLKDRAAILSGGAAANGAFWIAEKSGKFITSSYYMTALPDWAQQFNASDALANATTQSGVQDVTNFFNQVGATPAGNDYELAFAQALIQGEQLGHHATTDLLVVSLSANDLVGHTYGPDSPQEKAMVDGLDTSLDTFFSWLDKNIDGGIGNVWVALSADHGVAPAPSVAASYGLPAAAINVKALVTALNAAMNNKFSPGEKLNYVLPGSLPYIALDERSFQRAGINEQEAEDAALAALPDALATLSNSGPAPKPAPEASPAPTIPQPAAPASPSVAPQGDSPQAAAKTPEAAASAPTSAESNGDAAEQAASEPAEAAQATSSSTAPHRWPAPPTIAHAYTRLAVARGEYPMSEFGELLAHSYSPHGGWWIMLEPEAFQMDAMAPGHSTHFSAYNYDRHVPLAFFGAPFAHGTYHGRVQPVDMAATLASLLGINQPSSAIGTVLNQAVHTPQYPAPARVTTRRPARRAPDGDAPANPTKPEGAAAQ